MADLAAESTNWRSTSPQPSVVRRRRLLAMLAVPLALVVIACLAVPAARTPMLRGMGWTLVAEDPVRTADAIVITIEGGGAAVLEAADLVRQGYAPRVAVFQDPPTDSVDREFVRRGVPYEDGAARLTRLLKLLGVANVQQIPRAVAGTEDEGRVLPIWCADEHLQSIIVVGTADHSRRLRRVLHRAFDGRQTTITVRYGQHSTFDPDTWWQNRSGVRTEIMELEKLLFDVVRHPLSS